jgi:hypothetical protein
MTKVCEQVEGVGFDMEYKVTDYDSVTGAASQIWEAVREDHRDRFRFRVRGMPRTRWDVVAALKMRLRERRFERRRAA